LQASLCLANWGRSKLITIRKHGNKNRGSEGADISSFKDVLNEDPSYIGVDDDDDDDDNNGLFIEQLKSITDDDNSSRNS
jgi:hypothetical protein